MRKLGAGREVLMSWLRGMPSEISYCWSLSFIDGDEPRLRGEGKEG